MKLLSKIIIVFFSISTAFAEQPFSNANPRIKSGPTSLNNKNIDDKLVIHGASQISNSTISNLKVIGSTQATNLKSDKIKVEGPFQANNIESRKVKVEGSAIIENSKVEEANIIGDAVIKEGSEIKSLEGCGFFKLENSKVMNLKLDSNQCEINNSEVIDITFTKPTEQKSPPSLKITGNSSVKGNIVFESGDGIVYLDEHSLKNFDANKIKGGKVEVVKQN
jgi:hypothetical protein